MIRSIASILSLLMLAAPLAAAGGVDGSVRYLDGQRGCYDAESRSDYGNYWSTWSYAECRDEFSYAAADVRAEGQRASAGAGATEDEGTKEYRSGQRESAWGNSSYWSWSSEQGSSRQFDGWSRHAWARAAGANATAAHGCSSSHQAYEHGESQSSGYYGNDTWSSSGSSSWRHADHDQSACGVRGVAGYGGTYAVAGVQDGCSSSWSGSHSGWHSSSEESWSASGTSSHQSSYACGPRAFVGGPATAEAGLGNACQGEGGDRYDVWTYGNQSGNRTTSWNEWTCQDGVSARGPDDARVFAGRESRSYDSCEGTFEEQECWSESNEAWYASLAWAHNPLSPHEQRVHLPLP